MSHLNNWPLLRQLSQDLGSEWPQMIIHGVTFCDNCPAYQSEEGKARLALQKLQLDIDYISALDIRILCVQRRLKMLQSLKQKQQEIARKRRHGDDDEERGMPKKARKWRPEYEPPTPTRAVFFPAGIFHYTITRLMKCAVWDEYFLSSFGIC